MAPGALPEPRMGPRRELANVREVEILSDEESTGLLSGQPDGIVVATNQVFEDHGVGVVPKLGERAGELFRYVLVELDLHSLIFTA